MNTNAPDPGIYRQYQPHRPPATIAVFLDRDGVIVEETGYLHKPEDVEMIAGAAESIARLNCGGIGVVEVTNQAGIGRGYYTWYEFRLVQAVIEARLAEAGAVLDGVLACAYHPDGKPPFNTDHPYRKPNPGMIFEAQAHFGLDLADCWLIGDKISDLEAGRNAGVGNLVLVRTGYGREHEGLLWAGPNVHVVETLQEAVNGLILARSRV